ncbi:uncharacterized protein [Typha latifolia]|uniref:uncharacterized protein isoform X1 n=1 Tax=Typha latifolia TaxID=4733 RepID=UPI003C2D2954
MPSPFPVLNNKPIDQWKVTELKDELRRRRLPIKGLKDDLVRRLDEALRTEMEATKEEEEEEEEEIGNGFDTDSSLQGNANQEEAPPSQEIYTEVVAHTTVETNAGAKTVGTIDSIPDVNEGIKFQDEYTTPARGSHKAAVETVGGTTLEDSVTQSVILDDYTTRDSVIPEEEHKDSKIPKEEHKVSIIPEEEHKVSIIPEEEHKDSKIPKEEHKDSIIPEKEHKDPMIPKEEHKDTKLPDEDVKPSMSESKNQVSEVSPDLGFQVKNESISTDSISIIEKSKLKDNLNADNFDLELEVVKPEMVQPSSSIPLLGGDLQQPDDNKELVKNQVSLEEIDYKCTTNVDSTKKEDSADGGSPEKLNLDRSSGDESMEEDVTESKQIESNIKPHELDKMIDVSGGHDAKLKIHSDAATSGFPPEKREVLLEEKTRPAASTEKRKIEAECAATEAVGNNETFKRQRRWNSENVKVPEQQTTSAGGSIAPKDVFQPTPKRSFTRSDSALSVDSPKERIVPPSQKTATTTLRIDRFVRPFTLKAVQELLGKTGSVCSFWMDHIKTHCYVTYSSVEEAVATRNAVYDLQWPPNGGNHLLADFVDPQEVKLRLDAPLQSPAPVSPSPTTPKVSPFQQTPSNQTIPRQNAPRQQLPPPPLPPPPPLSNLPSMREKLPPPPPKKAEPPALTLDDLFKKTKASPRIYYLPLSEEQVATKVASQSKSSRE